MPEIQTNDDELQKFMQHPDTGPVVTFLQMVGDPEFQAVQVDRKAALVETVLIATTTERGPLGH